MAALQHRTAFLEGRVTEHSQMLDGIRETISSFEERVDRRFESLEQRMDRRFESLEQRMDRRFEGVDRRLDGLDVKVSRQFMWLVGLHVTTLMAIVAALLTR
jgi:uncharacterized coiled-coil protein SlyX